MRKAGRLDLSDPANRWRAQVNYLWYDHAILRHPWHNFMQIAPGVYRSNQPTHRRFARYKQMGINTILNLRGANDHARYFFEKESCDALGLTLVNLPLSARRAPPRAALQELIATFRRLDRPFLMHCKSGADRASIASAIYLMAIEKQPVAEARKMLSPRFVHLKFTRTGVLDHILDRFEAAQRAAPHLGFERWVDTMYDADEIQAEFDAKRGRA